MTGKTIDLLESESEQNQTFRIRIRQALDGLDDTGTFDFHTLPPEIKAEAERYLISFLQSYLQEAEQQHTQIEFFVSKLKQESEE